jgi:hypothetical protein
MGGRWHRTCGKKTHLSTESGMGIMDWVQFFFVRKRIISAVKRVEFLVIGCHT